MLKILFFFWTSELVLFFVLLSTTLLFFVFLNRKSLSLLLYSLLYCCYICYRYVKHISCVYELTILFPLF